MNPFFPLLFFAVIASPSSILHPHRILSTFTEHELELPEPEIEGKGNGEWGWFVGPYRTGQRTRGASND
jgi:hypothetical protein